MHTATDCPYADAELRGADPCFASRVSRPCSIFPPGTLEIVSVNNQLSVLTSSRAPESPSSQDLAHRIPSRQTWLHYGSALQNLLQSLQLLLHGHFHDVIRMKQAR